MRIVVIGAVAAGTSAAAKARRNDDLAEIVMYEKDQFISYSGCGMPYYIGGEIEDVETLTPRDAAFFKKKYNVDVLIKHEVLKIDTDKKELEIKNLETDEVFVDHYDKLVIATGASSFKPNIEGSHQDHVFYLRNINDVMEIKGYMNIYQPKKAVIAGTGFIGFEVLDNFRLLGIDVEIVELAPKITPNLDEDMATYLENELKKQDVKIHKSKSITKILEDEVVLSDGSTLRADMVVLSVGVRPNTKLAQEAGIKLGITKAIATDDSMKTNIEDVYACGDCIETISVVTKKPVYRPLGSTANKTGRIAGDVITGGSLRYKGTLGTGIFKIFDIAVATTGLNEKDAISEGYETVVCHNIKVDRPEYTGGNEMLIKAVADKNTGKLLGVQIIGKTGVDKRIDVFATLITYGATVDELFHLDLAYSPPFSTTKDPVHYTGMILDNAINKDRNLITSAQLENETEQVQIIDARSVSDYEKKGCVQDAVNIPHAKLREKLSELNPNIKTITYCNKGVTGNAAQNILISRGFKKVYNLSGGHKFYKDCKDCN